jgi:hypothetical protein
MVKKVIELFGPAVIATVVMYFSLRSVVNDWSLFGGIFLFLTGGFVGLVLMAMFAGKHSTERK